VPGDRFISALGPTILTERLILRPPAQEDFERWAAFMASDHARFVGGPAPRSTAWRFFATMAGSWVVKGFGMFSVVERRTERWVGRVGPWMPEGWPGPEVGWGISPDATGMGYASEAAAASIDFAFDELGWTEVIHCIDPANTASQGVARRLGSRVIGPGRMPPPYDEVPTEIWGQTRDAWRARLTR